jgi:hypothetical protein
MFRDQNCGSSEQIFKFSESFLSSFFIIMYLNKVTCTKPDIYISSRILRSIAWIWHLFLARVREIPISGGVSGPGSSPVGTSKRRPLFSADVSGESPVVLVILDFSVIRSS